MSIDVDRIPQELRDLPQWVLWRTERRDGKPTKVPYQAQHIDRKASSTDSRTWAPFSVALQALREHPDRFQGIGVALAEGDPLAGIDIDGCLDEQGRIKDPAIESLVREVDTYTEVSPSGTGLRLFLLGRFVNPLTGKPGGNAPIEGAKKIEIYSGLRYLTVTGRPPPLEGLSDRIEERQPQLDALVKRLWPEPAEPSGSRNGQGLAHGVATSTASDDELLDAARVARNGAKFSALFDDGDMSAYDQDHSRADLALCSLLAHRTGADPDRIDQLFRRSALFRDKWDRTDYRDRTIAAAISSAGRNGPPSRPAGATANRPDASAARGGRDAFPRGARTRPRITYTPENLGAVVDEVDRLLGSKRPPSLFQKSGVIMRVVPERFVTIENEDGNEESHVLDGTEKDVDGPVSRRFMTRPISVAALKTELSRELVFQKPAKKGPVTTAVPMDLVRSLHAEEDLKHLPPIEGISDVPLLRPDGSLHAAHGYDPRTGYSLTESHSLRIKAKPTKEDAKAAASFLIENLFGDFPLEAEEDKSAALAALLSLAARPSLAALIPAFLGMSPIRGSGKTLLFKAIHMAIAGQLPFVTHPPTDKDEWKKTLFSFALEGVGCLVFDNMETGRAFGSPALDMALTSHEFSDRILGQSRTGKARLNAVYFMTGNNVAVKGDLARRVIPIRQLPKTDRPEKRTGFRHPDLLAWVRAHRREILEAIFTILVAHAQAGRRRHGGAPLGTFEKWDRWIRSAIIWIGLTDPCKGMEQVHEQGDDEATKRADLLEALNRCLNGNELPASAILAFALRGEKQTPTNFDDANVPVLSHEEALYQALRPENGWKVTMATVATRLRGAHGNPAGGLVLENRLDRQKKALWRVEEYPNGDGGAGSDSSGTREGAGDAGDAGGDSDPSTL